MCADVQYILDSVVAELANNAARRFTYVEMAFFYRWWREQTEDVRATVRQLVAQGTRRKHDKRYVTQTLAVQTSECSHLLLSGTRRSPHVYGGRLVYGGRGHDALYVAH